MPCRNDDGDCPPQATVRQDQAPAWMLCEAMVIITSLCKQIDANVSLESECSMQLLTWWKTHQVSEEDRVRQEAASKLSPRERIALGIDASGRIMPGRIGKAKRCHAGDPDGEDA